MRHSSIMLAAAAPVCLATPPARATASRVRALLPPGAGSRTNVRSVSSMRNVLSASLDFACLALRCVVALPGHAECDADTFITTGLQITQNSVAYDSAGESSWAPAEDRTPIQLSLSCAQAWICVTGRALRCTGWVCIAASLLPSCPSLRESLLTTALMLRLLRRHNRCAFGHAHSLQEKRVRLHIHFRFSAGKHFSVGLPASVNSPALLTAYCLRCSSYSA